VSTPDGWGMDRGKKRCSIAEYKILAIKVRVGVRISYARFHAGGQLCITSPPTQLLMLAGFQSVITLDFCQKIQDLPCRLWIEAWGCRLRKSVTRNAYSLQERVRLHSRRDDCLRPSTLLNHSNSPKLARKRQGALVRVDDSLVGLTGAPPS